MFDIRTYIKGCTFADAASHLRSAAYLACRIGRELNMQSVSSHMAAFFLCRIMRWLYSRSHVGVGCVLQVGTVIVGVTTVVTVVVVTVGVVVVVTVCHRGVTATWV